MKNYYVMNDRSQMLWRDTLEGCRAWVDRQTHNWTGFGMKPPVFRIFYDTGTEPVETHNAGYVPAPCDAGESHAEMF